MSAWMRWQRLSRRERLTFLLAAALLTSTLLWRFAWLPLQWRSEAARAAQTEHVALARQLANAPAQPAARQAFTPEQLHASLIEAQIDVKRIDISTGRAQLTLEGAAAALWPWLERLDSADLKLETIKLAREGDRLRLIMAVSGLAPPD